MDYSDKDKDFFIEKFYDDYYGAKWNWGKEVVTITYSFPSSSLRSGSQGLITNLTREFTTAEKEAITSAINLWDNELETIEFKYVEDDKFADLTFGFTYIDGNGANTNYGYWEGYWVETNSIKTFTHGIIRFEIDDLAFLSDNPSNALRQMALHEIGNVLGLGDITPTSEFESVLEDPQQSGNYSTDFTLSNFDKAMIKAYYDEIMTDYYGTDEDDVIDGSELSSDITNIYPKKGNDQLTNLNGQTVVASPGDDSISGTNVQYAFWNATESPNINLLEGWADDGFGGRDTISGITTIHGTSLGMTITGTSAYEHVLLFGGNNTFKMGGGDDKITYHLLNSTDYVISSVGDEIHVTNSSLNTLDIITGVKKIVFSGDNKTIDIDFFLETVKTEIKDTIHTFNDDTIAPAYTYVGVSHEAKLISWFSQAVIFLDINQDGIKDVIAPMWKGYGTGIDTSTPFIALTTKDGTLTYDAEINATMPITTGGRRSDLIQIGTSSPVSAVTVNHSTEEGSKRNSDSTVPPSELILIQSSASSNERASIFPKLPFPTNASSALFEDTYSFAVDAHAMAVGDINGDGLDDIFIGHSGSDGPYELIQQNDGTFLYSLQPLYAKLLNWPLTNEITGFNILLDAALVDINNDGFDDFIAGFGSGSASSLIFINDNGQFSEDSKIALPNSVYGTDNQYHMKTMPSDFDHDGDIDLAIHWSRAEPYYGGNYIQILLNDGQGNFTDVTNLIPSNSLQDAYGSRLEWREPWQLIDMNNDGHMDIAGSRSTGTVPLLYLNDGEGRFEIKEIALDSSHDSSNGTILGYGDFDQDNIMEIVIFRTSWTNMSAEASINSFYLLEMSATIGTGPDYVSGADSGAPGFNERYYLNENSSAKDAVAAGTYASGLKHYLAVGKDEGLKTFAINTKVHGYSGDDTIVLREGDESALGYAGNDSIEGAAGNDVIDGGDGYDTAIFRDSSVSYTITSNANGSISVAHSTSSDSVTNEGTDILTNIEYMQFSDKTVSKISLNSSLSESINSSVNILEAHSESTISGTLNFNAGNNIIILDGQATTYRGLEGDDTYFVSQMLPKNSKISITDTSGDNTIQLPVNTYIDKSLFTKNAAQLTLEDGREVTISGADKFTYNVGGNITSGREGKDLTFSEFSAVFGVYDILNTSGAQTGTISDMYII